MTGEEPEFLFAQRNEYHGAFHGKPFHDNEIAGVYLLVLDRPEAAFTPEACEVESVHWFSVREILRAMRENDPRFCLREAEFCCRIWHKSSAFRLTSSEAEGTIKVNRL